MKKKSKGYLHNRELLDRINVLLRKRDYEKLQKYLSDLIRYFMLKYYGYFDNLNSAVDTCSSDFFTKYVLSRKISEIRTSLIYSFIKQYVPGGYYYKELVANYKIDDCENMDCGEVDMEIDNIHTKLDFDKVVRLLLKLIKVHIKSEYEMRLLVCKFFVPSLKFKYVKSFHYLDVLHGHIMKRLKDELKLNKS